MRNVLIISDLSDLQPIIKSEILVGGSNVYAVTNTTTNTGVGYAVAVANAVAIGEMTYTNTNTKTEVKKVGSLNSSKSDATAIAYAKTGNKTVSSSSFDTSISLNLTYI